jgi:hypothetical protein
MPREDEPLYSTVKGFDGTYKTDTGTFIARNGPGWDDYQAWLSEDNQPGPDTVSPIAPFTPGALAYGLTVQCPDSPELNGSYSVDQAMDEFMGEFLSEEHEADDTKDVKDIQGSDHEFKAGKLVTLAQAIQTYVYEVWRCNAHFLNALEYRLPDKTVII